MKKKLNVRKLTVTAPAEIDNYEIEKIKEFYCWLDSVEVLIVRGLACNVGEYVQILARMLEENHVYVGQLNVEVI